jgi:hypothetical protein
MGSTGKAVPPLSLGVASMFAMVASMSPFKYYFRRIIHLLLRVVPVELSIWRKIKTRKIQLAIMVVIPVAPDCYIALQPNKRKDLTPVCVSHFTIVLRLLTRVAADRQRTNDDRRSAISVICHLLHPSAGRNI